ncbi:MAG TPA: HAD-IA family hydrolase [Gemmatimonadaceae bacterium]|nr:HAD-IA family hydrolase [Gemmatimonadaceae bacterium]
MTPAAAARSAGPDAAVFDLDGVITFTARVHAATWKELFDAYLRMREQRCGEPFVAFDAADYRTYVDGRPRYDGVRTFLESRGISLPLGNPADGPDLETISGLGNRKNALFHERVRRDGVDVDRAAVRLVRALREAGVKVGVASSSRNAAMILDRAGLTELFEACVDGVLSARLGLAGKPRPDIFLQCLEMLGVRAASRALMAEDAIAGVAAGRAGGFGLVLGVARGRRGIALREHGADWIVRDFTEISVDQITRYFAGRAYVRPNALARWDDVARELTGGRIAIFVDDGIVTAAAGDVLREVAAEWPTTLVSDRGPDDPAALAGASRVHRMTRAELHQRLSATRDAATVPLYIGGDPADDAFQALAEHGIGIVVTVIPEPTAARFALQDAIEVRALLARLAARAREHGGRAGTIDPGRRR